MNIKLSVLLLMLGTIVGFSQKTPESYFGDNYGDAVKDCLTYREDLQQAGVDYNLPPRIMAAVVFPELIRYNRFRDLAETAAVEQAYVRYGKDVADFSIGPFQMKPSFVEDLERRVRLNPGLRKSFKSIISYTSDDTIAIRRERVKRLKDPEWQVQYLACFTAVALQKYAIGGVSATRQVQLLSSAYNRGLGSSLISLEQHCSNRTFPFGKKIPTGFSYADVALHYYEKDSKSIQ